VAAARLGHPGAQEQLRTLLAAPGTSESREVRVQAALALAYVKDRTGVPVLAETLDGCEDGGDILFCQLVIIKLGALRDRRAVPALLKHLPEWQNRREMVQALGRIADPSTVPALAERLEADEYVPVRAEAASALGRIGGREAVAGLERCLRHEHEPSVLAACRAARSGHVGPIVDPDSGRAPGLYRAVCAASHAR
jgi:HEAT repeat protein